MAEHLVEQVRLLDIVDMLAAAQEGCEREFALRQKLIEAATAE